MREVHLFWNPESISGSDFGLILEVTDSFEVVAHLDVTPNGVRQLVRIDFAENKGPEDLNDIYFLEVDGPLDPNPAPEVGGKGIISVWNRHPISVAAINFDSLHVIPPYTISKEGVGITIRGLPTGVSGFLKAARAILPPDKVKVVEMKELEDEVLNLLTPKQMEAAILAVRHGYYENPRKVTMRELSEEADIPRSTLQEHLSKAEAALVEWAVETHLSR